MNDRTSEPLRSRGKDERTVALFLRFFQNHPLGMLISDREGTSVHVNRKLAHMLGYDSLRRFPVSRGKRLVTCPSGIGDPRLWTTLLRDGLVMEHMIDVITSDGTRRRLCMAGSLLEKERDGNHVAGWILLEEADDRNGSQDLRSASEASKRESRESTALSASGIVGDHPRDGDCTHGRGIRDGGDDMMQLLLDMATQQKKDLEARLARNFDVTILPILDHLKALDLSQCQRVLVETLDFNIKHIMAAFDIRVAQNAKRLSDREREICQMIRAGKSSRDIAQALGLKYQTVMAHRKHIKRKLDPKPRGSRLAAVLKAQADPA